MMESITVGTRCTVDNHYGTVKFIGEIPTTEGTWLGIDWDDPRRGRHDGSKDGVVYFTASHPTSGSFVRPQKVSLGLDILSAVKERYGIVDDENAGIQQEEMFVYGKQQRTTVEVVGAKSVNLIQSQLDKLHEVALRGLPVSGAGEPGVIAGTLPNVVDLDISDSLIGSWTELANIASQLPKLKTLNISDNIMNKVRDASLPEGSFRGVQVLFINRCHLTWSEVLEIANVMPALETVHACFNKITTLSRPNDKQLVKLKTLNLEANKIQSWDELLKISSLPSLENLILNSTGIEKIEFPDVPSEGTTSHFPKLKALSIFRNKISDWSSINELNKLQSFEDLKIRFNPITQDTDYSEETVRSLMIAKIRRLKSCNRSEVNAEERQGSELDYLRMFGREWRDSGGHQDPALNRPSADFQHRHPRYQACIDAHGPCEDGELVTHCSALKNTLLTLAIDCPLRPEIGPVKKKLPATMTLQKLKYLVQRLYKGDPITLYLTYSSSKLPNQEFELDNDMREIAFFGVEDGDTINVKW